MTDLPRVIHVGAHILEEEETLLHVHWQADHTMAEQHEIYDLITKYLQTRDKGLLLFDLSRAGTLTAEQRHASGRWWRQQQLESIALAHYGHGFATRILVGLIARAVALVTQLHINAENFATEAEARAWLANMHGRLRPARPAAK